MRVPKPLTLCIALLFVAAAPAWSQVAAPRLTPTQATLPSRYNLLHVTALDISNPAASIWGTSAVSAGAAVGGKVFGPPGLSGSYTGGSARLVIVGDHVSFGMTRVDSRLEVIPVGPSRNFDVTDTQIELGLRFTDWLALGVGRQSMSTAFFDSGVPDDDVRRRDLPLVGLSMRFWEDFYLGLASGTDTVRIESFAGTPGTGATEEGERSVSRWGIAYASRSPDLALHVEYYAERRSPFYLPLIFGPDGRDDAQLTGGTIEVVWSNLLFAFEAIDQRMTNFAGGIPLDHSSHSTRLSLGWVPVGQIGLSLTRNTDLVDKAGIVTEFNGTSMNAVWRF